jgi:hypothetical protein
MLKNLFNTQHQIQSGVQAFLLLFLCCLLHACFTPIADPVELPYDEKLVIRGIIVVGEQLNEIQISRTLPPLDTFSYQKIFIANAKASITVDGQVLPMELQPLPTTASAIVRSLYRVPNVRVQAGKTYSLNVEWTSPSGKTLIAKAQTLTPQPPLVDSVRVIASFPFNSQTQRSDTVFSTEAFVQFRPNESIRAGTVLLNAVGQNVSSRGFGENVFAVQSSSGTLRSNNWTFPASSAQVLSGTLRSRAIIETYDTDYNKYYQTRNRSGQPSPLNPGGPNIDWNVTGDGIGMFIGMAQVQRIAPVRR